MLGLAIEEEEAEAAARVRGQPSREELGHLDGTDAPHPPLSKADRERLEVIEILTGKREYVPPGLRPE